MKEWLLKTAWPMTPPLPYSPFHLIFAAAGILSALTLARRLQRLSEQKVKWLLFGIGLILVFSESYKQFFLYYIVNQEQYDWWYFPFQLCSLPMYFCILLPLIPSLKTRKLAYTFLYDFNLLGAVMVFADPSGFMHPYWALTVHSFLWHIVIIFSGLLIWYTRVLNPSKKTYFQAVCLFFFFALIATCINILTHPFGNADMFYISPYYKTTQLFFSWVAGKLGIWGGNLCYLLSICLGAGVLHLAANFKTVSKNTPNCR